MESKESTTVELKGCKYEFGNWEPELGMRMLTRLIKICGEPLAKAIIGMGAEAASKGLDAEIDNTKKMELIGAALGALAMNLEEETVVKFVKDSFTEAYVDGKPLSSVWKAHFMGRPGLMLQVVRHQLQHQLSDFLELLPVSALS